MVLPNRSIESFFPKTQVPPASYAVPGSGMLQQPADGLAPSNAGVGLQPETEVWHPKGVYEQVNISDLQPGLCKVTFKGRIVNSSLSPETNPGSKISMLPKGYHFLVIKDDTGLVAIKLLVTANHHMRLQYGRLVTIWATTAITSTLTTTPILIPHVNLLIPIHPTLTSTSSVKFHPFTALPTLFRLPLPSFPPFTTLRTFLTAPTPLLDARLLVCVDAVLPPRALKSKNPRGHELLLTEVRVFDETTGPAGCPLKLWCDKSASARGWTAGKTVLLLTNPRLAKSGPVPELGVGLGTLVEVDPEGVYEVGWLRRMAAERGEREVVCVPFPEGGVPEWVEGGKCTLAEMDERVRGGEGEGVVARANVVVLGTTLGEMKRMGELCCAECCLPLYANTPSATCQFCNITHSLVLNPAALGNLADETGCLSASKIVWSDRAYTELLFGTGTHKPNANGAREDWRSIVEEDVVTLEEVDEKLAYCRVTLVVGWQGEGGVGRVCVLGVDWNEVVEM